MTDELTPHEALSQSRVLFSAEQVSSAYDALANAITAELGDSDPVVIAVLNGGVVTAVELLKRFEFPCRFDYVHLARYGDSLTGGAITWHRAPSEALAGRTVLIVDDILDEGITLAALYEACAAIGVHDCCSAVLLSKDIPGRDVDVDFVGLAMQSGYVFGCGMDYQGYWRGLDEIRVLGE